MNEDLINRITYYLSSGGLFNPELADHLAVRNLLMECRDTLAQRTWVGLTLTQVKLLGEGVHEEAIKSGDSYNWVFYKHINEALKEKNNG